LLEGGGALRRLHRKKRKREINSAIFQLSRGTTEIIALQVGRTICAWSDTVGEVRSDKTTGIEFESF